MTIRKEESWLKNRSCQTNGMEQRLTQKAIEISRSDSRFTSWWMAVWDYLGPFINVSPSFQENGRLARFCLLQVPPGPNTCFSQWNMSRNGICPFHGDTFWVRRINSHVLFFPRHDNQTARRWWRLRQELLPGRRFKKQPPANLKWTRSLRRNQPWLLLSR